MRSRRTPSEQFLRRLDSYRNPKKESSIQTFRKCDWWLWAEAAALALLIPTALALWIDIKDRKTQRIAIAWELVTRPAPGNAGKGPALEYLNSEGIPLVGIDLSAKTNGGPSYLERVDLSRVNLDDSILSGARLTGADFSNSSLHKVDLSNARLADTDFPYADLTFTNFQDAIMPRADLSGSTLIFSNLSGVSLVESNLSNATLSLANLDGANLKGANLAGAFIDFADLSGVKNLSQSQLDETCGDRNVSLPKGMSIKPCPDERKMPSIHMQKYDYMDNLE